MKYTKQLYIKDILVYKLKGNFSKVFRIRTYPSPMINNIESYNEATKKTKFNNTMHLPLESIVVRKAFSSELLCFQQNRYSRVSAVYQVFCY